ncbi:MAG: alpha/beta fold hydrolase, partial [Acidimicrobiia bacterium]|nr:alpha/beta fold hydrolase [Acidimicrobiia bacterium]
MSEHHGERTIEANGIELCVDSFGDPADPAILLIMGAGGSMLLWEEGFCDRLADGGRYVMRYDNRDTGKTTSCPLGEPNYTIDDMAADAVAVLDAYGVEQAHIVGASMGGMITQVVGLNHPERVLSLTPIMSTPDPGAVLDAIEGRDTTYTLSPPTPAIIGAVTKAATQDWDDRESVLENRVEMFELLTGPAHPYDAASRRALF